MFQITTTQHGGRDHGRVLVIAECPDYLTARDIARSQSALTSGRCLVVPPEGSLLRTEAFANGVSEG